LKDKANAKAAREILQNLNELFEVIVLDDFEIKAQKMIEDSDITAKDLEALLREILGVKYRSGILSA